MVHSKVMIVDDRFLRIGSANINNRSMGADTECDLAFEATTEDHRDFFCSLRRGLIGHFCGVSEATIADNEDDLLGFIDRHAQSAAGRALLRIDCETAPGGGVSDIIQPIADPKQPLNLQRAARRMWTARTLLAVLGTVVALTGLALAWRTTSLSDYTDIGYVASFISRHAQSAWAPLIAVAFFMLGGLVVFPGNRHDCCDGGGAGAVDGRAQRHCRRAGKFARVVHDRPFSRPQAAPIAARRARRYAFRAASSARALSPWR